MDQNAQGQGRGGVGGAGILGPGGQPATRVTGYSGHAYGEGLAGNGEGSMVLEPNMILLGGGGGAGCAGHVSHNGIPGNGGPGGGGGGLAAFGGGNAVAGTGGAGGWLGGGGGACQYGCGGIGGNGGGGGAGGYGHNPGPRHSRGGDGLIIIQYALIL
jgi:hypothetical protein